MQPSIGEIVAAYQAVHGSEPKEDDVADYSSDSEGGGGAMSDGED